MKLYDAICGNEELRLTIPEIIEDLIKNPGTAIEKLRAQAKQRSNPVFAHALRILATLCQRQHTFILEQIRDGVSREVIDEPIRAVVLQLIESDRWIRKYGESTYDIVLALPDFSRVISISTTEVDMPMDPIIPRLSEVRLENVHLYSFFNRAHAIRGRRIGYAESNAALTFGSGSFKPFMRTCQDIERIGNGASLNFFTPFFTNEGIRLGFFFALVCRIASVGWVPSPTGFGVTTDQTFITLCDFSGSLKALMNTEVFNESMANPIQHKGASFKDPADLDGYDGDFLIIGVWILGKRYPEIAFFGLLDNDLSPSVWGLLSFMNSRRKVSCERALELFGENCIESTYKETKCLVKTEKWLYYKEEAWPSKVFLALEANGFSSALRFSDALPFDIDYATFKMWSGRISRFFHVNPHLLKLCCSCDPFELFEQMHKSVEKEIAIGELATRISETRTLTALVPFTSRDRGKILAVSCALTSLGYAAQDLFSQEWDNGGSGLEEKWLRARKWQRRETTTNETTSALIFIMSMKFEVNIPIEVLEKTA
jgi:hypothetical protein